MDQSGDEETPQYPNPTNPEHDRYGFMEREVAFKLLASHAMVDPDYFEYLRNDPVAAAAHLHIALEPDDLEYLTTYVDWERLAEMAEPVRESLRLDIVTNSW
jgi:hypothetical protein